MSNLNIDMSLDDIIQKNRIPRGGQQRSGTFRRPFRRMAQPRGGGGYGSGGRGSFNNRRGGVNYRAAFDGPAGPGKLLISNLDFGVTDEDIHELFSEFGMIKNAAVHYDKMGQSIGTAEVVYVRRGDAVVAMNKYNGVPLDGRAMHIEVATSSLRPVVEAATSFAGGRRTFSGRVNKPFEGGRGRGRRNEKRTLPSKEDLDKELDSYVNSR